MAAHFPPGISHITSALCPRTTTLLLTHPLQKPESFWTGSPQQKAIHTHLLRGQRSSSKQRHTLVTSSLHWTLIQHILTLSKKDKGERRIMPIILLWAICKKFSINWNVCWEPRGIWILQTWNRCPKSLSQYFPRLASGYCIMWLLNVKTEVDEGVPCSVYSGSLCCLLPGRALKESPGPHQSASTFHNSWQRDSTLSAADGLASGCPRQATIV